MKRVLLMVLFFTTYIYVYSQIKKNSLYIITGEKHHPNRGELKGAYFLSKHFSFGYTRKLNKNLGVNVEYSLWRRGYSPAFRQINDICKSKNRNDCNNKVYARV